MDNNVLSGLLNPVRMKMLQLFMKNDTATVRRIAEDMSDIPPATLYRHLNKLVADNIIEICAENKVRGTVEKVYRIKMNPFAQINELAQNGNDDELFNIFYTFNMTLLSDFRNYLDRKNYDLEKDKVGFRSYPVYLSDDECNEFFNELRTLLIKIQENKANKERRLRKFSFVMIPGDQNREEM